MRFRFVLGIREMRTIVMAAVVQQLTGRVPGEEK